MIKNFFHNEKELRALGIKCGKNCRVHSSVMISHPENLLLGNNVRIDSYCSIISSSKIKIGNFVHIGSHSMFYAGKREIHLKDFSAISAGVKIFTQTDDYSGKNFYGPFNKDSIKSGKLKKIVIKKYCILGTNAVVTPNASFGEGTVVGALSLANFPLKAWSIYYGQPLKFLIKRSKKFKRKLKINLK